MNNKIVVSEETLKDMVRTALTESIKPKVREAVLNYCQNEMCESMSRSMDESMTKLLPAVLEELNIQPVVNEGVISEAEMKQTLKVFCEAYIRGAATAVNKSQLNEWVPVAMAAIRTLAPRLIKFALPLIKKYGVKFFASGIGKKILAKLGGVSAQQAMKMFASQGIGKMLGGAMKDGLGKSLMKGIGTAMALKAAGKMLKPKIQQA